MEYVKLYENFLLDRNKLIDSIKVLDDSMLNEILDLIPDIVETDYIIYEFKHIPEINSYELELSLNYEEKRNKELRIDFDFKKNFFDKYLNLFKSDLKRMDNILSDYDIKYFWTYHKVPLNHSPIQLVFNDTSFFDKKQHDQFYERFDNLKIQFSLK